MQDFPDRKKENPAVTIRQDMPTVDISDKKFHEVGTEDEIVICVKSDSNRKAAVAKKSRTLQNHCTEGPAKNLLRHDEAPGGCPCYKDNPTGYISRGLVFRACAMVNTSGYNNPLSQQIITSQLGGFSVHLLKYNGFQSTQLHCI